VGDTGGGPSGTENCRTSPGGGGLCNRSGVGNGGTGAYGWGWGGRKLGGGRLRLGNNGAPKAGGGTIRFTGGGVITFCGGENLLPS